jgi:hypothetical protein
MDDYSKPKQLVSFVFIGVKFLSPSLAELLIEATDLTDHDD